MKADVLIIAVLGITIILAMASLDIPMQTSRIL
jgi:hypothetical protein